VHTHDKGRYHAYMPDAFDNYIRDINHLLDKLEPIRVSIRDKRQKNDADLIARKKSGHQVASGPNSTGPEIDRLHVIKADLKQQYEGLSKEIDRLLEENS
jgi:hypothetical protein